jgi:hypothetical protein
MCIEGIQHEYLPAGGVMFFYMHFNVLAIGIDVA